MLVCILAACVTTPEPRTYLVFFTSGSAELDPAARIVVANVSADVSALRPSSVGITGSASRAGTAVDNQQLSEERARVVEQALLTSGVPMSLIVRRAVGATQATSEGVADRQVEIRLDF
jgi:outer membrane protein OmpA-like peptidoglycan-associated protein